ncbi:hypothetical protein FAES_1683 [Fibrella aestuarina BUZ 2]|uniref:Uncharacterized protein n=1 Tax=Fibrella aestuarina BUZ 2 TaxID=1166018 RepID=I0K6E0_9BACT|nr:hypothetical protein FAES_1683 [Fibrella aestuarina BUZ 2]
MHYLPYLFMVLYGLAYLVGMTLGILGILALLKYLRKAP